MVRWWKELISITAAIEHQGKSPVPNELLLKCSLNRMLQTVSAQIGLLQAFRYNRLVLVTTVRYSIYIFAASYLAY